MAATADASAQAAKTAASPQAAPVDDAAFAVIAQLLQYDPAAPLHARIIQKVDSQHFTRDKFVFNGWRAARVPGLIAFPRTAATKHPVVVLIDGIGGWKERWWQATSWNRGRVLIDSLLASGFAVAMIDAPASGERIHENDFVSAESFLQQRPRLRDHALQTALDHRRLLDYLATRNDVDTTRIGALGLSQGGATTFYLGAVDPRVKAGVAGLTPTWGDIAAIAPLNYAPRVHMPVLLLMGRTDRAYTHAEAEQLSAAVAARDKQLVWYDVPHRVPEAYAAAAADWFRRFLYH